MCMLMQAVQFSQASASLGGLRIALYGGKGAILGDPNYPYKKTLEDAGSALGHFSIEILNNSADVQQMLTSDNFDVVFFPGGYSSQQAAGLGQQGLAAVKNFVSRGGGYIGTCGGAFLALESLRLYGDGPKGTGFPALSLGTGLVEIEFTERGFHDMPLDRHALGGNLSIFYQGGPVISAADLPSNVTILSWFRTSVPPQSLHKGKNTPSMTYAEYGAGRVVLNSPHAEHVKSQAGLGVKTYQGELAWVSRRGTASGMLVV